jgi:hypothetical protein
MTSCFLWQLFKKLHLQDSTERLLSVFGCLTGSWTKRLLWGWGCNGLLFTLLPPDFTLFSCLKDGVLKYIPKFTFSKAVVTMSTTSINTEDFFILSTLYRIYTKEWCGSPLFTIETAPVFCVYPVFVRFVYDYHYKPLTVGPRFNGIGGRGVAIAEIPLNRMYFKNMY